VRDGQVLLERGADGAGRIFATKLNDFLEFQTPTSEAAIVARRDSIQHGFFEPLHIWGKSLCHFYFGTALGKDRIAILIEGKTPEEFDVHDPNNVIAIFKKGQSDIGPSFVDRISEDMRAIGYDLETVDVGMLPSVTLQPRVGSPVSLTVKERDLRGITDQLAMSQGMFRTLSVIIQLTYFRLTEQPSCIVIDDIGEGLDFERSSALIRLLIERANNSEVQLVLSTNDRFIMNNVPLEAWSVLQRTPEGVRVFNHENSRKQFDDFAFTGLNNFDFFATDFVSEGPVEDEEAGGIR
jgi:hypothetical protein